MCIDIGLEFSRNADRNAQWKINMIPNKKNKTKAAEHQKHIIIIIINRKQSDKTGDPKRSDIGQLGKC